MFQQQNTPTGKLIKELRRLRRITPYELAAAIHKDRATIYRYENGEIEDISAGTLQRIAEVLGTTMDYLLSNGEIQEESIEFKKRQTGNFELHTLEIDVDKNIYKVNGEPLDRCTKLTVDIEPEYVFANAEKSEQWIAKKAVPTENAGTTVEEEQFNNDLERELIELSSQMISLAKKANKLLHHAQENLD